MSGKIDAQSITMRATRKVARLVDSTWDAVAHTVDRGVLLIRRRQGRQADPCPFLRYEVARQS